MSESRIKKCISLGKIIFILTFFIAACGTPVQNNEEADKPLRITERGSSLEEAKRRAFRRAVEMRVGVLMVGERITINQDFQEHIYSYSSGFIKDYRHISSEKRDGSVFETFDIWVKDSAVADGLLKYQPSSVSLEGKKLLEIIRSRDSQREAGELLLARVLEGWPNNAVKASFISYKTNYEIDRSVVLSLQGINISWNPLFEKSLREILERISIKPARTQQYYALNWSQDYSANEYVFRSNSIVKARREEGAFSSLFKDKYYAIGDNAQLNTITTAFSARSYLYIELRDRRKNRLDNFCVFLEDMFSQEYSTPNGRGWSYWTEIPRVPRFISNLKVVLDRSYVEKLSDVEISIVSSKTCEGRR